MLRGDRRGDRARSFQEAGTESIRGEIGTHHAPDDAAGAAVGDDPLDSVSGLDPDAPLVQREEDQDAVVLLFPPDPPAREELRRHRLDLLAAEIVQRDDGELRPGLLRELLRERFDRVGGSRVDDLREVVHVARGRGPVPGQGRAGDEDRDRGEEERRPENRKLRGRPGRPRFRSSDNS